MDNALKCALMCYIQQISQGIIVKNDKLFDRLSKDVVVSIQEPIKEYRLLEKKDLKELSQFSKDLMRHKYITNVCIYSNQYLNKNFFVDNEERRIFSTNYREALSLSVNFNHESGSKKSHVKVFLNPDYDNLNKLLDDLFYTTVNNINEESTAPPIKSGQHAVIFGPGASGTTFHEGMGGHLLSGSFISKGISTTFRDKIGEKIMPLDITIMDDPSDVTAHGYYTFDDEGIPAQKTVLVENGVLKNYLLDRHSAAYFGQVSNGHSRSEWVMELDENGMYFPLAPEPRTSNMKIYSPHGVSDKKLEAIMRKYCKKEGLEYGLYIDAGAGEVNVETSAFMIYPHSMWKIYTDGRRERVTDGIVVGNAYELLKQIAAIGNEPKITLGTCGSISGGVPVQESAPAIFLPRVTITAIDQEKYTKRLLEAKK
jgi:predicted Zn-dependent protease